MPQDGSGNYAYPLGTRGVPDETIESAAYNNFLDDLVDHDLNIPRPIHRGGTGATTADGALANLGAEKAAQLVTNYDTHVWLPGSFRSAGTATAGPVDGHAFAGIVYINEPLVSPPTNANVTVSARDMNDTVVPSRVYVRDKKANVWGPWTVTDATTLPFPPGGGITSDTILEAIQELDADKADITYVDAQDAKKADITYVNSLTGLTSDGMAYLGMQVNGAFLVNQERTTGVAIAIPGVQSLTDGWNVSNGAVSNSIIDLAPRGMNLFTHRPYAAPTAPAAGEAIYISTNIEGYRTNRLSWGSTYADSFKSPITIAFISSHHRPGLYCVAVRNAALDRSYVATYTQTAADVEQLQLITIPPDLTGTWLWDQNIGMSVVFSIATGSSFSGTANAWQAGNKLTAPGVINGAQDTADRFRITGVMVIPGIAAPTIDRIPFLVRPYDEEFMLCQRYYQKQVPSAIGSAFCVGMALNATTANFPIRFPVQMRVAPILTTTTPSSNFQAVVGFGSFSSVSTISAANGMVDGTLLSAVSSGMTAGQSVILQASSTSARIFLDARM